MFKISFAFMFRPWFLATVLCFLYSVHVANIFQDPLALVTIGERFAPEALQNNTYSEEGYDGQFVYYITRYGFGVPEGAIDVPAYRFQRILLPVLGYGMAFGQTGILEVGLLLVNLIAVALGTYLLERLLMNMGVSRWYAAGYAFSLGVFGAARLQTTEALAYGLVIIAIYIAQRERWLISAVFLALATLAKETAILFTASYGLWLLLHKQIVRAFAFGLIAVGPFVYWQLALYTEFNAFGVGSGGEGATEFELLPLGGFFRIITDGNIEIFAVLAPIIGIFVLLPVLWGLRQIWADSMHSIAVRRGDEEPNNKRGWTVYTMLLFTQVVMMLFVPFSTYRELLGILRFIVGMQIAVILYAAERRKKRALRYSTVWFMTTFIIIFSDNAFAGA